MGRSTAKHVSLSSRNALTSVLSAGNGGTALLIAEVSCIYGHKIQWATVLLYFAGERNIKALRVKCGNLGNGCAWVGELGSLDKHHDTCNLALLACPNKCRDGTKTVQVLRKNLATHLKEKCPNRSHKCPHCKRTGKHCDITTSHLETCTKLEVPCLNEGCNDRLPRCDIPEHRKTCPFEEVTCKYATIGCEDKPLRKELKDHENNDQLHLHITMETILQQNKKLLRAETRLGTLEGGGNTNKATFKMARFSQYKASGEEFFSPPFYTHHGGYKMCIGLDAHGEGDGKGTHVTVCVLLMRGENDDNVTWPFIGVVTVEILNQLADKEHHQQTITFPEDKDDDCNSRVVDMETAAIGRGCHTFISHADLGPATNRQFLKDDCLYFRVSAKATPNPKPWLTCTS